MSDIESNINLNIDGTEALATIKALQSEISRFHAELAKQGAASAALSSKMQKDLTSSINASGKFSAQMRTIQTTTEAFTTSLEKNKLGMGEYFRYAMASTRTFGNSFKGELETIDKVARERVKDLQTQYIKMGRDANGAMKAIAVRPLALDLEDFGTKTQIAAQKHQLFNQLLSQGSTNLLNWGKNTQWAGRQLMVGFSLPLATFAAVAGQSFMKLEKAAISFRRVYGDAMTPASETAAMTKQVQELATSFTQYGVAVSDTMTMAAQAAAQGATGSALLAQVTQTNKLAVLGSIDQQKSLETITSLTNTFGIATKDLANNIDFLNAVENQTVLNIDDMTTAIPIAAPVVQSLGGDVRDLSVMLTAMKEGGINASEGANALKSGLAALINPTDAAKESLGAMGVSLDEILNSNKGNAMGMIQTLSTQLDKLDPTTRAQAIEQLFGKFQFARMSTLLENINKQGTQAAKALELTKKSAGELAAISEKELSSIAESPAFKFQKAIADFQAAVAPVGESFIKIATPLIGIGTDILKWFNGLGEGAKTWTVAIVAGLGLVAPVLLMITGLIANGAANITKFVLMLGNVFSKTKGSAQFLGETTNYMTKAQLDNAAVAASLDQVHMQLTQRFTSQREAIDLLIASYQRMVAVQRDVRQPPIGSQFTGTPGANKQVEVPGSWNAAHFGGSGTMSGSELMARVENQPQAIKNRIEKVVGGDLDKIFKVYDNRVIALSAELNRALGETGSGKKAEVATVRRELTQATDGIHVELVRQLRSAGVSESDIKKKLAKLTTAISTGLDGLGNQALVTAEDVDTLIDTAYRKVSAKDAQIKAAYGSMQEIQTVSDPSRAKSQREVLSKTSYKNQAIASEHSAILAEYGAPYNTGKRAFQFNEKDAAALGASQSALADAYNKLSVEARIRLAQMREAGKTDEFYAEMTTSIERENVELKRNITALAEDTIATEQKTAKTKVQSAAIAENTIATETSTSQTGGGIIASNTPGRIGKFGKIAGAASIAGTTALMAGSMMGGPVGDIAGQMMPLMFILDGLQMMNVLFPQIGAGIMAFVGEGGLGALLAALGPIAIAVGALAVGLILVTNYVKDQVQASRDLAESMSATTKVMDGFAKAAGTVNPTEAMNQQREIANAPKSEKAKELATFGQDYLKSEDGKAMLANAKKSIEQVGAEGTASAIAKQLGTAVASGIMSGDQAKSIVDRLSKKLGDTSLDASINAKITNLIGPTGSDIISKPLELGVKMVSQSAAGMKVGLDEFAGIRDTRQTSSTGTMEATTLSLSQLKTAEGLAASYTTVRTQGQLALDALTLQHQKTMEELTANQDLAGLKAEQLKYDTDKATILKNVSTETENMNAKIRSMGKVAQAGLVTSSIAQTRDAFKGTDNEKQANAALGALEKSKVAATTVLNFTAQLQSGTMSPETMDGLFKYFGKNEKAIDVVANISARLGDAAGSDAATIAQLFSDKEKSAKFLVDIQTVNGGANGQQAIDAMNQIREINAEGGVQIDVQVAYDKLGVEGLASLENEYKKVQDLTANGPVTMTTVLEQLTSIDQSGIDAMTANNDWFNSLDPVQQRAYITSFITVYKTATDQEASQWAKNQGMTIRQMESLGIGGIRAKYAASVAKEYTTNFAAPPPPGGNGNPPSAPASSGGGGGSSEPQKDPTSFLDSVVKKLRDVRVGAQGLTETFASSWAAINGMFGNGASVNVFGGLEQQMRSFGAGQDLIDMITGMSAEEYAQRKNDLFNFDAAGNITGFRDMLSSIGRAMNAISLGNFQSKQQQAIATANDQTLAVRKLVAAGMSYTDAFNAAQDATTAHAVAGTTDVAVLNQIATAATAAAAATANMTAAQALAQTNQSAANMTGVLSFMNQFSASLTDAQKNLILTDQSVQELVRNFATLTPEQLAQLDTALANADLQASVTLQVNSQTIGGMEKIFQEGFSNAMESFAAQEQAINLNFQLSEDPFKNAIQGFQNQIEDLRSNPGGLNDLQADLQRIGDKETDINNKYKDRFAALDKIEAANQRIAALQRSQLSIADALTQGDIASAARATEELRAQDQQNAMTDQRKLLTDSQNLELEALRGQLGLSRKQIEEEVRRINAEILDIQNNQIEPAQHQVDLLERQKQAQLDSLTVLGLSKDEWTKIKNGIDLAKASSDSYATAMQNALDKVVSITDYWANLDGRKVSTIHEIIETTIQANTPAAPAPAATPTPAPTPAAPVDYHTEDYRNDMARRVIRGEFGNGATRVGNLGDDYQWIQDRVNDMVYHRNGYAKGGFVTGGMEKMPSIRTGGSDMMRHYGTDTVPAMLTPGEFVIKNKAVQRYGKKFMDSINDMNFKMPELSSPRMGISDGNRFNSNISVGIPEKGNSQIDGSVYNNKYSISVNVQSTSNPQEIAMAVTKQIKDIDAQRIRGNRL
jgi:TP901 family phage tail tape measure protein